MYIFFQLKILFMKDFN